MRFTDRCEPESLPQESVLLFPLTPVVTSLSRGVTDACCFLINSFIFLLEHDCRIQYVFCLTRHIQLKVVPSLAVVK